MSDQIRFRQGVISIMVGLCLLSAVIAEAQLTDVTQTTPNVPGGAIGKSLQEQVGEGRGDALTPGSSIYLIRRDPARSIRRGRQLFQRKFTDAQGLGPRVEANASGNIHDNAALGAGIADSCAGCHGRPRGSAGFGGDVATRPDSRDAPHLFGLGLIEMLADEMTAELRRIRKNAIRAARRRDRRVTRRLESKGINFGRIIAHPNGRVDTSDVEGVDPDLRVKPFFAQGCSFSIREFIVGALKDEMGLESPDPVLCRATDPNNPRRITSPSGFVFDPDLDTFNRPPVCDAHEDGDDDGVVNEVDPALVDHMEFYLLNYFKPGQSEVDRYVRRGSRIFEEIGCTACHVRNLTIKRDRRIADVDTVYDEERGIFNRLFATASTRFEIVDDGEPFPQLVPMGERFVVKNVFTDLKRHDLGPAFYERNYDGSLQREFMTEPLWGVGSTAPYGHDGRSINLKEVILRHGGEAARARRRFARLHVVRQRMVMDFLRSLVLFPPDDTASNLNPGRPGTRNPQDPDEHGTINLGALFQLEDEGAESRECIDGIRLRRLEAKDTILSG
ncbi:MAG: hypothetical protein ETSY2_41200 [Candidatus Entotheonella gemina]|uniref:Thiol oxidoreductase-like protein n=1 Tax=Candidatus Entotheonella gemina TaxID=1429439 RepID=W4LPH4_9BACT|nr:MAG: hypothetical protein ETSY2_41200 [Candidatus Entotheonella gemina]